MQALFHGGVAGKQVGDSLEPAPPHQSDGCPICVARAEGRTITVREYRAWVYRQPAMLQREKLLERLREADDFAPMDPPSENAAVYVTTSMPYARWYAARSQGDLYEVRPVGPIERSATDNFPSWTCSAAVVVRVVERTVRLVRRDRRELDRLWKAADIRAARREARD